MNLKSFTKSFVSRIMPKADGKLKPEEQPTVMTFTPKERQAVAAYTVRAVHSCERHRTRSLRELANCAMHCTKSCMLADMHEDA